MNLLLKSARIIDPSSPHNGKKMDLLIENGIIKSIKATIKADKSTQVIESSSLAVSPGWFDMQVTFHDPGYEYKEDISSGTEAAAFGGFTGVALMPSTVPPVHTKAQVEYIKNKSKAEIVDIYPVGTISHNHEGKDISEMYDMHLSGAVAFSDDKKPVSNAGLLLRALQYAMNFKGLIMTQCDDKSISQDGKMHEGSISTSLGLKGIPALAEELMLSRNISLAEYAGGRIHISSVSTARSVSLIKAAKTKKLNITSSVNAHHLALDDSSLEGFDTNFKVNPPLRTKADIEALKKGLADGTIDAITSDHLPQDTESKMTEFDYASNGMTGLETAFALVNTVWDIGIDQIVNKLAISPREILNLNVPLIKEGEKANLTFFDTKSEWVFEEKHIRSKSKNTPFTGKKLKGKVLGIYNKGKFSLNSY
jgi:dihydroorotase